MICPIHSYFAKSLQEGLGTYMSLASPVLLPCRSKSQNSESQSQPSTKHHKVFVVTLGISHSGRGLNPSQHHRQYS